MCTKNPWAENNRLAVSVGVPSLRFRSSYTFVLFKVGLGNFCTANVPSPQKFVVVFFPQGLLVVER